MIAERERLCDMPNRAKYVSSTGEVIQLDSRPVFIGTAEEARSDYWSYEVGYKSLKSVVRQAREISVDAYFASNDQADKLRRLADYDMGRKTPGKLYIDDWFQRAFIVGSEASEITRKRHKETLTVALLDGVWGKLCTESFFPVDEDPDADYLDLPTDVLFDLSASTGISTIRNNSLDASPVKLTFFGPAVNPYVIIGGNRYALNATIPDGSRVEVDGTVYPRTIRMIAANGDTTNAFSAGERGDGEGSGEYIFEKIQPGYQIVNWPGGYGVDVSWLEQEGAVPWKTA